MPTSNYKEEFDKISNRIDEVSSKAAYWEARQKVLDEELEKLEETLRERGVDLDRLQEEKEKVEGHLQDLLARADKKLSTLESRFDELKKQEKSDA